MTDATMAPLVPKLEPMTQEEFRAWFVRLGLNQTQLAERLKVKQPDISRWLNGVHAPPWYLRLALERLEQILAEERRPQRRRRGVRSDQDTEGTDAG